jgi:type IX secretion system PorP/SprF family membrane protein
MTRKIIWYLVFGLLISAPAAAQDAHFSQQYANKLHLNPAFAGIRSDYTLTGSYRNQWPGLDGSFITNQVAADFRFKEQKSAIGFTAMYDKAGSIGFTKIQATGMYAYHTPLSERFSFSGGLAAGYGSHTFDSENFQFGDQLSPFGFVSASSAEQLQAEPASRFLTISTGALVYTDQFWLSLAGFQLNQPDAGFGTAARLPARIVVNTGYKLFAWGYYKEKKLKELSFTPTLTYMHQGGSKKLDVGLYTTYTPLTLGILYRGFSAGNEFGYDKSLVTIIGVEFEQLRIGYSYDAGLSRFSNRIGGSHEISLTFENVDVTQTFKKVMSTKNYRLIACPAF